MTYHQQFDISDCGATCKIAGNAITGNYRGCLLYFFLNLLEFSREYINLVASIFYEPKNDSGRLYLIECNVIGE